MSVTRPATGPTVTWVGFWGRTVRRRAQGGEKRIGPYGPVGKGSPLRNIKASERALERLRREACVVGLRRLRVERDLRPTVAANARERPRRCDRATSFASADAGALRRLAHPHVQALHARQGDIDEGAFLQVETLRPENFPEPGLLVGVAHGGDDRFIDHAVDRAFP